MLFQPKIIRSWVRIPFHADKCYYDAIINHYYIFDVEIILMIWISFDFSFCFAMNNLNILYAYVYTTVAASLIYEKRVILASTDTFLVFYSLSMLCWLLKSTWIWYHPNIHNIMIFKALVPFIRLISFCPPETLYLYNKSY